MTAPLQPGPPAQAQAQSGPLPRHAPPPRPGPPLWLLAELTYRCPLHCVFCYNPVELKQASS